MSPVPPQEHEHATVYAVWRPGDSEGYSLLPDGWWAHCTRCGAELAFADDPQTHDWLATLHAGVVPVPGRPGVYHVSEQARNEWKALLRRQPRPSWRRFLPRASHGKMPLVTVGLVNPTVWVHCLCGLANPLSHNLDA